MVCTHTHPISHLSILGILKHKDNIKLLRPFRLVKTDLHILSWLFFLAPKTKGDGDGKATDWLWLRISNKNVLMFLKIKSNGSCLHFMTTQDNFIDAAVVLELNGLWPIGVALGLNWTKVIYSCHGRAVEKYRGFFSDIFTLMV